MSNTISSSLLSAASERLAYLGEAQSVYANNIANLDTPHYQPNGVESFSAYLAGASGALPMTQDNPADLPSALPAPGVALAPDAAANQQSPDGNGVDLDQQLEQMSNADLQSQFAGNLYKTYMGLYKTALGQG